MEKNVTSRIIRSSTLFVHPRPGTIRSRIFVFIIEALISMRLKAVHLSFKQPFYQKSEASKDPA